tara:strand:+ start:658 stop:966 length:309 start_codon:yes stop_codon:yes gene_type:complete
MAKQKPAKAKQTNTKEGGKALYKPFPSKLAGKKYSVYVKSASGGKKLIHFGQKGAQDWRSGTASAEKRKSYRARASKIKKKDGSLAVKDKNTANYWAYHYLW